MWVRIPPSGVLLKEMIIDMNVTLKMDASLMAAIDFIDNRINELRGVRSLLTYESDKLKVDSQITALVLKKADILISNMQARPL